MSSRPQVIEPINADIILGKNEDEYGETNGLVEKGSPDELIIQLNLNYIDHGSLIDLAKQGARAKWNRAKEIEVLMNGCSERMSDSHLHPLNLNDVRVALANAQSDARAADDLVRKIERKKK